MEVYAITRYIRMSPRKAVPLARKFKGLHIDMALELAKSTAGKPARVFAKTIKSALANATRTGNADTTKLHVKQILVEKGPMYRFYWTQARGMPRWIKRRFCHVKVILTDNLNTKGK